MKLISLNPFAPREPKALEQFAEVCGKELKALRRKPTFWISLLVTLVCSLYLTARLGTVERITLLVIIFSSGFLYDTVISHFIKRIISIQEKMEKENSLNFEARH